VRGLGGFGVRRNWTDRCGPGREAVGVAIEFPTKDSMKDSMEGQGAYRLWRGGRR
jgi:hypothetical protein